MPLTYDLSKCFARYGRESFISEDGVLDAFTEWAIYTTMVVGIDCRDVRSYREFVRRAREYTYALQRASWEKLDAAAYEKLMGMRTNASTLKRAQWKSHLFSLIEREASK